MENRELICIGCPMGCPLTVEMLNGKVIKVSGNTCKRGEIYGQKECTNPTRILTSSLQVLGGIESVVSVKTEKDIPKDKLFDCMKKLKGVVVQAPVHIGDIIIENICGTGVNIIATKEVKEI